MIKSRWFMSLFTRAESTGQGLLDLKSSLLEKAMEGWKGEKGASASAVTAIPMKYPDKQSR